jgi:hypothetical protein
MSAASIHTELVLPDSFMVYIYLNGGSYEKRSFIDTTCLFSPKDDGVECHFVKGELSDEINAMIGLKAYEMGYKMFYFSRPCNDNASRWANFIKTEDGLDYYSIDLEASLTARNG